MPAPTILSVAPIFVVSNSGSIVDIEGTNFQTGVTSIQVFFNDVQSPLVVTLADDHITAKVPVFTEDSIAVVKVVTNLGEAIFGNNFYIVAPPLPTSDLIFSSNFLDHKADYTQFGKWTFTDNLSILGSFTADGGIGESIVFNNYDAVILRSTGLLIGLDATKQKGLKITGLTTTANPTKALLVDVDGNVFVAP